MAEERQDTGAELTQEQVTAQLNAAVTLGEDGKPIVATAAVTKPVEGDLGFPWNVLQTKLSNDENKFEIPEYIKTRKKEDKTLTDEDLFDELVQITLNNFEVPEEDPFLEDYKRSKEVLKENFDHNEFVKSRYNAINVLNMDSETYLENYLKQQREINKTKWTDDEINNHIKKMDPITRDSQVAQMKSDYKTYLLQQDAQRSQEKSTINAQKLAQIETSEKVIIDTYVNNIAGKKNLSGVDFGEADLKSYQTEVYSLLKRDPKTGITEVEKMLQSNDVLFDILPLLWLRSKGKLTGYLNGMKTNVKDTLEGKLGNRANIQSGGPGSNPFTNRFITDNDYD